MDLIDNVPPLKLEQIQGIHCSIHGASFSFDLTMVALISGGLFSGQKPARLCHWHWMVIMAIYGPKGGIFALCFQLFALMLSVWLLSFSQPAESKQI